MDHGAHAARERDFAEIDRVRGQGRVDERGDQRRGDGEVGRRLADFEAARDVEVDVVGGDADAAAGLDHGEHHAEARGVPAHDGAAGRAERARGDQRLDLAEHRARALHAGKDRRARGIAVALVEKERRGIGDFLQAERRHLEDADLVGRAVAVLDAAEDAEGVARIALEIEHRVDHVLDDARARDLPVLGDVADEDDRGARFLREPGERLRRGANLGHRTGRAFDPVGPERLDGIDDDEMRGRAVLQRCEDDLGIGLAGEQHIAVADAEPLGAKPDLRHRLFARDVDDALAMLGHLRRRLEQQRRLADPGIAADQNRRAHHETAAEHAIQFVEAGGDAGGTLGLARERNEFNRPAARNCRFRTRPDARSRQAPRRSSSTRRKRRTAPPSGYAPNRRTGRGRWFWSESCEPHATRRLARSQEQSVNSATVSSILLRVKG